MDEKLKSQFYKGIVFTDAWIYQSVKAGKLMLPQDFTKFVVAKGRQMSFSRTKFTIREIIKIFDVVHRNPYKRNKNPHYWQRILEKGLFPGRSVHSVNAQWQKFSLYGDKAEAVKKALQLSMPYCVSF